MTNLTEQMLDSVLQTVGRRAAFDADCRRLALTDAAGAINVVSSLALPDLHVRFMEQTARGSNGPVKSLLLPPLLPMVEKQSAHLDSVAGGMNASAEDPDGCYITCET